MTPRPVRRLAYVAFAFGGGMLAVRYLLPAAGLLPLGLVCALLALVTALGRRRRTALILLGVAAALLWSLGYDALVRAPARALEGRTAPVTVQVTDFPRTTAYGVSVTAEGEARMVVYLDGAHANLRPGDTLSFTAYFRPADHLRGERTDTYTADGIFLLAYPKGPVEATGAAEVPLRYWPALWRQAVVDKLYAVLPAGDAGLSAAVLLGDKSGLGAGEYAAMQRAGLAHAVAVSGMHVSYLMGMLLFCSGQYRRRTALIGIPVLVAFALLTGCSPSVVRAAVMQSLFLLAPLVGRESDGPTALGAALLALLLQNPYAAGSVSLQLSFASVAGILLFSRRAVDRLWKPLPWKNKLTYFVVGSLGTTLGALALTTPLLAYYFGSVSLIAPLSNLLVLPAISLLFLGSLGVVAVGGLSAPLSGVLAWPVVLLSRYVRWAAAVLARAPFAAVALTSGYLLLWVAFGYGLFLLWLLWRQKGKRLIVPCCCAVLTLCLALLLTRLSHTAGPLTVTVLDVGQGQSVLLRAGSRTALVDCGGNGRKNAGDIAADYLADRGRDTLDMLVLTHFHADHAGGVAELLERVNVSVLAAPEPEEGDALAAEILAAAEGRGTQIVTVEEDVRLVLGSADLTLYAPLGAGEANEAGLSVLCTAGDFDVLLTGDMDATVEKRLVKYGDLPQVELLLAGHHGGRNSTSALLLETVTPEVVVVSSGYNTYGHPHPASMLRAQDAGANLYRTDLQGNITISVP